MKQSILMWWVDQERRVMLRSQVWDEKWCYMRPLGKDSYVPLRLKVESANTKLTGISWVIVILCKSRFSGILLCDRDCRLLLFDPQGWVLRYGLTLYLGEMPFLKSCLELYFFRKNTVQRRESKCTISVRCMKHPFLQNACLS